LISVFVTAFENKIITIDTTVYVYRLYPWKGSTQLLERKYVYHNISKMNGEEEEEESGLFSSLRELKGRLVSENTLIISIIMYLRAVGC
jgi:hypothetical protein